MKRKREIIARLRKIRTQLEGDEQLTDAQIDDLEAEAGELRAELANIERRSQLANGINADEPETRGVPVNPVLGTTPAAGGDDDPTEERRAADLPEYRSGYFKRLLGRSLSGTESRAIASSDVPGVIPTDTENKIITKAKQIAPMLDEITLLHVPGNITISVESDVSEAELHTENTTANVSDDGLITVHLGGYELIKVVRISETVRTMSISAFEAWIVDIISRGLALKAERFIVAGTGSNQPHGMKYARTWTDGTSGRAWAGAALADVDLTTAIGLLASIFDSNAKFFMNKRTFWNNVAPIRDDSKAPIVKEDGNGNYLIHGYPVKMSDMYSDGEIYLGDAKYIYGNLAEGFTIKSSEHSGFTANAIDFRGTAIFDCDVAVPEAFVKIAASL